MDIAKHPLGVGHHGGKAPVGGGHRGQAARASVGVEGVGLGGLTEGIDKAHGSNGLPGITAARKIGVALAMGHRDRQARAGHALEKQAG